MRKTGQELMGETPTPSAREQLKDALWKVRLRSAPDTSHRMIGCWCYHMNTDEQNMQWSNGEWTHDHRCRAAQEAMKL